MPRPPTRKRTQACTCSGCGRVVDAADPSCARCGVERPESGWSPLGMPLPSAASPPPPERPRAARAPSEPVIEDAFEFAAPPDNVIDLEPAARAEAPTRAEPPPARPRPKPLRVRVAPPSAEEGGDAETGEGEPTDENAPRPYAGRYRLEEKLPSAPDTRRHIAVQEPAVRRVVLTVLGRGRAADTQQALEARFLRDARVLARLRHPGLSPVHDVGRASDGTVYVTEEVPYGLPFTELADGRLGAERLLGIVANVAGALAAMHEAGVVHRGLRADAVNVAPGVWRGSAGGEVVSVGRYGLHVLPEEVDGDDDVETALVTAPEVVAGQEPDEAADLYAVGVLLHRGLVGKPPYAGTAAEIRAAAGRTSVRLPRSGERLPNRLCDVAERCLSAQPEHRYPSARALLRELEELARPAPVEAPQGRGGLAFAGVVAAAVAGALVPTVALLSLAAKLGEPAQSQEYLAEKAALAAEKAAVAAERAALGAAGAGAGAPAGVATAPDGAAAPGGAAGAAAPAAFASPADGEAAAAPAAPAASGARPAAGATPGDAPSAERAARPRRPRSDAADAAAEARVPASASAPASALAPTLAPAATSAPAPESASAAGASAPARARESAAAAPRVAASAEPARAAAASESETTPEDPPPRAPTLPNAASYTGLWLGKAPGGSLALDLVVKADGRVTGRARRSDRAGEGVIVGRIDANGRVELQVTDATGTESYSGELADGVLAGRITSGGRGAGRFRVER